MTFHHPAVLWLLVLLLPAGFLIWRAGQRKQQRLRELGGTAPTRTTARAWIVLCALALLFLAAAGPEQPAPTESMPPARLVIICDVSRSMLATDVAPNRLARATRDAAQLLSDGLSAQIALIAFRSAPVQLAPFTEDTEFLSTLLQRLSPDSAPPGPTRIAPALEQAQALLAAQPTPGAIL